MTPEELKRLFDGIKNEGSSTIGSPLCHSLKNKNTQHLSATPLILQPTGLNPQWGKKKSRTNHFKAERKGYQTSGCTAFLLTVLISVQAIRTLL